MARYYKMFKSKDEQNVWEKEMAQKNKTFRVCMRMTTKQLKEDLPHIDTKGYVDATIYTFD